MNPDGPDIKIYTIKDLKSWLYHNQEVEGLSARVISMTRANAILHNPYVEDNDPIAAAIFESGDLAAYTAAFPDWMNGRKVWWFSTLRCYRKYRGKGYPLIAVGTLAEEFGEGNYFDMWGAKETVEIFHYLGLNSTMFEEYVLEQKNIHRDTLKGEIDYKLHRAVKPIKFKKEILKKHVKGTSYRLRYVDFIDDSLYEFITKHGKTDLWPRTHEMMNWIIAYSFKHRTPLDNRTPVLNFFNENASRYWKGGVKVYVNNQLVGFYIIRESGDELSVKYLYYEKEFEEQVFASIAEHMLRIGCERFTTRNKELIDYLRKYDMFDMYNVVQVSFSYPQSFELRSEMKSQGGDGDGFV